MRFSPTKLLHGLLYSTPVLLLTLAACGGGGGGSTTPPPPAGPFTIGGSVSGLTGGSLVLRNNGGDDKNITTTGSYTFTTLVANGGSYNVTVLTQPTSQLCSVTGGSGTASANVTNVNVSCVSARTISVDIAGASGVVSIGPILQNNGGDNLFIPQITDTPTTYTFSTPVADGLTYLVTQLSRARSPSQDCTATHTDNFVASGVVAADVNFGVTCASSPVADPKFAYVTNSSDNTVSAYTIDPASGTLSAATTPTTPTGTNPYSVTVEPSGRFAYVANLGANSISAYSIDTSGVLAAIDANGAVAGAQASIATGSSPISITVHPSGKFAYVVNQGDGVNTGNTISAYSIDISSGALSAMDADGATQGTQATIATGSLPYAVTVDPLGRFAYVANDSSGNVSVYMINPTSGALTAGAAVTAGTSPRSVAVDPTGSFAFVAHAGGVATYAINQTDGALTGGATILAGISPRSVTVDPSGAYVYVANAGSNDVSAYTNTGGVLAPVGSSPFVAGTSPFSVNVDPSGQFVYVANSASNNVSVYSIGGGGALIPGSPVTTPTGTGPTSVTTTQ